VGPLLLSSKQVEAPREAYAHRETPTQDLSDHKTSPVP